MLMLPAKRLPRGLLLTVPNPSTSTVRAYCPAFKGANAAEMVRLAFVTAKRRGLFVPLAALPHNAKALPGCGMAVRRATVPYGNNGAFGCNRMEPPPDAKMWWHDKASFYVFTCSQCMKCRAIGQQM